MFDKQKLYYRAPFFLKNLLASLNSRKLDTQRHGADYERVLAEIAERDGWSAEQFARYQDEQLRLMVRHAARNVPHYRRAFADAGIDPEDISGRSELARLPILEKVIVRSGPEQLVDETLDIAALHCGHTSGTTGTPLRLYRDVRLDSTAFAYFDARCRDIAGLRRRRNRSVSLGGKLVAAPQRTKPPFWVFNRRWNQLYMSSYHLSPANIGSYVDAIRSFEPDYIEGYPSSAYTIARHIVDNHLRPIRVKACITTAETLFDHQRPVIEEAFECKTYNQYGCGETVAFAAECRAGSMHLSPDYAIVEVVDDNDQPVPDGQVGQLIGTSLVNWTQPFIRYRVGDLGSLKDGRCSCGSVLPLLGSIDGRTDAVLTMRDGRRFSRLGLVFKGLSGIVESQIVQNDYDKFVVRIVPADAYTDEIGRRVASNLAERVGKADIRIELVDAIERTAAGKFKAVVCNLPRD